MSNTLSYLFKFRAVRPGTNGNAPLGYATIKIYIGDIPMMILEGFSVREGANGLWLAPPQRSYEQNGETKYQKLVYLWPRPQEVEADNAEFGQQFKDAFELAWNDWCAQQNTEQPVQQAQVARPAPVARPAARTQPAQIQRPVNRPAAIARPTPQRVAPVQAAPVPDQRDPSSDALDIFSMDGGEDAFDKPPIPRR